MSMSAAQVDEASPAEREDVVGPPREDSRQVRQVRITGGAKLFVLGFVGGFLSFHIGGLPTNMVRSTHPSSSSFPPPPLLSHLAGCEEVKRRVRPHIEALRSTPAPRPGLPWVGWPPGLVFYGPEGTGKRTAARAIAGEAGAEFRELDLEDLILAGGTGLLLGEEGTSGSDSSSSSSSSFSIRDLFSAPPPSTGAASSSRVIYVSRADVFLPDSYRQGEDVTTMKTSVATVLPFEERQRMAGATGRDGGEDGQRRMMNQRLLHQLVREFDRAARKAGQEEGEEGEGAASPRTLLILSTSKRLVKPSAVAERFDQVQFSNPDTATRALLFAQKLPRNLLGEAGLLAPPGGTGGNSSAAVAVRLAKMTHGLNGRDISRICRRAAFKALGRDLAEGGGAKVEDVEEAVEEEKEVRPTLHEWERQTVAYHEAGHAVVSWKLKHADEMLAVSIVPDSDGALGYTQYNNKNSVLHTNEQVFAKICVALAGRYSERFFMKRLTTGARDDLQKVTALAYYSVASYGFHNNFISYDDLASFRRIYGSDVARQIDADVREVVSKAAEIARTLVKEHWDSVDKVATTLLERDTLTFHDMQEILGPSSYIPRGPGDTGTRQMPPPPVAVAMDEESHNHVLIE